MNHASVAHKITLLKEENQQNMTFKQKLNEYLLQVNVTFVVAIQRQAQKCAVLSWQVALPFHFHNKVCSFSLFSCLPSLKMIAHKNTL